MNVFVSLTFGKLTLCIRDFHDLYCCWEFLRVGKWQSDWTFKTQEGSHEGNLTGIIDLKIHYFEDGNVQLQSCKSFESEIKIPVSFTGSTDIFTDSSVNRANKYLFDLFFTDIDETDRIR